MTSADPFATLIDRWEEMYEAFTSPYYTVTKQPDAIEGLRQCIDELKLAVANRPQLTIPGGFMAKCNRCNKAIDTERDAFVTMPNAEQCGYQRRRPTAFAHARCFEKDIRASIAQEQKDSLVKALEIARAKSALDNVERLSPFETDNQVEKRVRKATAFPTFEDTAAFGKHDQFPEER